MFTRWILKDPRIIKRHSDNETLKEQLKDVLLFFSFDKRLGMEWHIF